MEEFQLSLLFKINGIGSASGLLYLDNLLYIISDSSTYLYKYDIEKEDLNKIALVNSAKENIAKKYKPDFEAIALKENDLYLFGSGSTENRNLIFKYDTRSGKIKEKDISETYLKIKKTHNIADDQLNIEGVIFSGELILLFQRGNGNTGKNGIIYFNDNFEDTKFEFIPFDLPKIKNVPATFTDAILVDDVIYFLATAEDTTSTYEDGEVFGSIIGTIDLKTMKLLNSTQISNKNKFEGLTLYKKTATQIELLLCEDNDTEEMVSSIYKLVLKL